MFLSNVTNVHIDRWFEALIGAVQNKHCQFSYECPLLLKPSPRHIQESGLDVVKITLFHFD